jgi:glycosyltransferase involved in cell wall biosynthesis
MTGGQPIRVLHVMPQITIGGAERQLHALIVNSEPQVVTHEVLYYSDPQDSEGYRLYADAGIKFCRVPRNKKRPIKFLRDLSREIKKRKPDIVHCWLFSGNIWGRWAAILAGIKNIIVAYRVCDVWYPRISRVLEKLTTKRVHYSANSYACADFIGKKLGVSPDRFHVIYNGISLEKFEVSSKREKLSGELNIPKDAKIVTMVGRLTYQKNYPILLKVARKCKDKRLPYHFMIVGHGEKESELKELSRQLEVADIVHFLGLRLDIPEILKSSDIFCFTTLFEGFPNVLLEAMAAGLPIVTTNFGGVDELIENDVNGKTVAINDVDGACLALRSYLDYPELAGKYGKKARETVRQRFSMTGMVNNTVNYYRQILMGAVR